MTNEETIRDEKLQYDINREAAKTSTLTSDKIKEYEYLTGEKILSFNQSQMIEQAKYKYHFLGKTFEKQRKSLKLSNKIDALKVYFHKIS